MKPLVFSWKRPRENALPFILLFQLQIKKYNTTDHSCEQMLSCIRDAHRDDTIENHQLNVVDDDSCTANTNGPIRISSSNANERNEITTGNFFNIDQYSNRIPSCNNEDEYIQENGNVSGNSNVRVFK